MIHQMHAFVTLKSRIVAGNHGRDQMQCMSEQGEHHQYLYVDDHRVIMSEKPSTHCPHEPETPAMLYPRGGIKVCL